MCIWHILLLPLLNHLQSHFLYIIPWKVNKARHTTNACKIICRKIFLPPKCVKHSLWMNFSFTSAQRHVHISFIKLWIMFESFLSLSLSQLLIWINKKWLIVPCGTSSSIERQKNSWNTLKNRCHCHTCTWIFLIFEMFHLRVSAGKKEESILLWLLNPGCQLLSFEFRTTTVILKILCYWLRLVNVCIYFWNPIKSWIHG